MCLRDVNTCVLYDTCIGPRCVRCGCVCNDSIIRFNIIVTLPSPFSCLVLVNATVLAAGETVTQIRVRENWGPRVVVRGKDGKEEILWGKDLKCCIDNPHPVGDEPYDALAHNKWNREKLRTTVKEGTLVQHLVKSVEVAPAGCTPDSSTAVWRTAKVLRVIRSGSHQDVLYSVQACRCIHKHSVKLTKRMLKRARRDN